VRFGVIGGPCRVAAVPGARSAGRSGCEITRYWAEEPVFWVPNVYIVAISGQKMQQIAVGSTFST
jgi:hypothetical protein